MASGLCIGQRGSQERGRKGGGWRYGHVADSLCSVLFHRPRLLPFLNFVCVMPWESLTQHQGSGGGLEMAAFSKV